MCEKRRNLNQNEYAKTIYVSHQAEEAPDSGPTTTIPEERIPLEFIFTPLLLPLNSQELEETEISPQWKKIKELNGKIDILHNQYHEKHERYDREMTALKQNQTMLWKVREKRMKRIVERDNLARRYCEDKADTLEQEQHRLVKEYNALMDSRSSEELDE